MAIEKTQESIQLSLYLKSYVNDESAKDLAEEIKSWPDIKNTLYISPEEAKEEFQRKPGFSSIIENLPYNPLPGVIVLQFQKKSLTLEKATILKERAASIKEVNFARLDLEWLQKIKALISVANQSIYVLCFLLVTGLLLIIGNTITLEVNARRNSGNKSSSCDPQFYTSYIRLSFLLDRYNLRSHINIIN